MINTRDNDMYITYIHPFFTNIACDVKGNIYNLDKYNKGLKCILYGSLMNSGYYNVSIKGKSYMKSRIIFEACKNILLPHDDVISYIDSDIENNSINNLKCVTKSENLKNRRSWSRKKSIIRYSNVFKVHPLYTGYGIDDDSNVININSKKILDGHTAPNLYQITKVSNKTLYIHRFVWECYYGRVIPRGYVIHHLDNNPQNNHYSNLLCCTQSVNKLFVKNE